MSPQAPLIRPAMVAQDLLDRLNHLDCGALVQVGWRDFEARCAEVLAENGYTVLGSLWFRGANRRYQIDVVAVLLRQILCIDCKAWRKGGGSYRSRRAAESQKERTIQLKGRISPKGLPIDDGAVLYPIVVTLRSEDLAIHGGVPIVPFQGLNTFVVDFDSYRESFFCVRV